MPKNRLCQCFPISRSQVICVELRCFGDWRDRCCVLWFCKSDWSGSRTYTGLVCFSCPVRLCLFSSSPGYRRKCAIHPQKRHIWINYSSRVLVTNGAGGKLMFWLDSDCLLILLVHWPQTTTSLYILWSVVTWFSSELWVDVHKVGVMLKFTFKVNILGPPLCDKFLVVCCSLRQSILLLWFTWGTSFLAPTISCLHLLYSWNGSNEDFHWFNACSVPISSNFQLVVKPPEQSTQKPKSHKLVRRFQFQLFTANQPSCVCAVT